MRRIPALDGLRGLAALWVLVGHVTQNSLLGSSLSNGQAVDLFMLISGYLMFGLHHWDAAAYPISFYSKRFFRLAPLYYLVLALGLLLTPWLASAMAQTWASNGKHGWSLDGSIENFLLHLTFLHGLIPGRCENTPLPDWSLSLEAQFYLIFPLMMMCVSKAGAVAGAILIVVAQIGALLVMRMFAVDCGFPALLPMKLHMFLAGMLIASSQRDGRPTQALLGIALTVAPFSLLWSADPESPRALLAHGLLAMALAGLTAKTLAPGVSAAAQLLGNPVLRWAGEMSYSVYLTHLIIMYPSYALLGRHFYGWSLLIAVLTLTIVASYALAFLLHAVVERPGIRLGKKISNWLRSAAAPT